MAVRASKKPEGQTQTFCSLIMHTANSTKYKLTKTLLCHNQSLFATRLQWLDILDCLSSKKKLKNTHISNRLYFLPLYFFILFLFKLRLGCNPFILTFAIAYMASQSFCHLDCQHVVLIFGSVNIQGIILLFIKGSIQLIECS